jgi:hypothetical protein
MQTFFHIVLSFTFSVLRADTTMFYNAVAIYVYAILLVENRLMH